MLSWSRHRRNDVLLKQARERTCDEGFLANDRHRPPHIAFVGKPWREMHQKLVAVCCSLLPLSRTRADWMHVLRQDTLEDMWCLEGIYRTRQIVTGPKLGLLIELAVQCLWDSSLLWSSIPWERHSRELLLVSLWVPPADSSQAEAWLSLLGTSTTADSCLLAQFYWAGLLVYLWSFASGLTCCCCFLWTELLISWQCRWDLFQRTFLNRSTSLYPFFSTTPGGWWARREVKLFKNHY